MGEAWVMPRRARLSNASVLIAGVVVALATFGLGFVLAYDSGPTGSDAGAAPVRSNPAVTSTTGPAPSTSATVTTLPTTTTSPTITATTVPAVVVAPTSTLPVPTTAAATTTAPTVSSPAPAAPGALEVTYPRDSQDRMVLLPGGSGAVILRNAGGTALSFSVSVSGSASLGTTSSLSGQLAPGEVRSVPVVADAVSPGGSGPHSLLSVFDAAGLVITVPILIA
jgi:hypothetical protein